MSDQQFFPTVIIYPAGSGRIYPVCRDWIHPGGRGRNIQRVPIELLFSGGSPTRYQFLGGKRMSDR